MLLPPLPTWPSFQLHLTDFLVRSWFKARLRCQAAGANHRHLAVSLLNQRLLLRRGRTQRAILFVLTQSR
jgi:hypothetical protein